MEGARGRLAARHEGAAAEHRRRDPAARGRYAGKALPAAGLGVVHLVDIEVAGVAAVDAAADGVEESVDGGDRQMVARGGDRGERGPFVGGRIVDLVRVRVAAAPVVAADCVDLAVDDGGSQRAARRGQRRAGPPAIGGGVVLVHLVGWGPAVDVAADQVELTVEAYRGGVMYRARDGGA